MSSPALVLVGCDLCGDAREGGLYVLTAVGRLCSRCWRDAGEPGPARTFTAAQVAEVEARVRSRMDARGGPDRYMVRKGRT